MKNLLSTVLVIVAVSSVSIYMVSEITEGAATMMKKSHQKIEAAMKI